jgi:hypothetical protein
LIVAVNRDKNGDVQFFPKLTLFWNDKGMTLQPKGRLDQFDRRRKLSRMAQANNGLS